MWAYFVAQVLGAALLVMLVTPAQEPRNAVHDGWCAWSQAMKASSGTGAMYTVL